MFLAEHIALRRRVALKILHPPPDAEEAGNYPQRFKLEAETLATLDHPNIVTLYDYGGAEEGRFYLAMEYIEGPRYTDLLADGTLDAERTIRLLLQVCAALRYAHRRGVIHRDLKPSNLLIRTDAEGMEQLKVVDFGLVKVAEVDQSLTREGLVLGSPHCMAPGEGGNLVHFEGGAPGYMQGTARVSGRKSGTAWRMHAGWDQTGRWSEQEPIEEGGALVPFLDDQTLATKGVRADARIDQTFLAEGLASFSAGYTRGMSEFYALGALGDYAMDYTGGFARGDLSYGPAHLRVFYNGLAGPVGPWASYIGQRSLDTAFDSDTVDVELEANTEVKTGAVAHRVNAGLGYRYKAIEWGYINGGEPVYEHHFSAFLQETATLGKLALVASLRADRTPLVPLAETISPRGAAILRVARATSVRLTGGTSYRAPTMLESYTDLAQPTSADGVYVYTVGDPDLLPERILTGEIGVHDESTAFHVADVSGYVNRVTNLIGFRDVDSTFAYYDAENNGYNAGETGFVTLSPTYLAFGGEVEARVFPLDGLDVYANTAVERILEQDGETTAPDESTSLLKVNGGVMYRSPWRVDVGAHVNFVSAQVWRLREYDDAGQLLPRDVEVPARSILTARVAARPFPDEKLELAVSGWNLGALAGNTFREHPNGQLVGARYWGEATWRF